MRQAVLDKWFPLNLAGRPPTCQQARNRLAGEAAMPASGEGAPMGIIMNS